MSKAVSSMSLAPASTLDADDMAAVIAELRVADPPDARRIFEFLTLLFDQLIFEERFEEALDAGIEAAGFAQQHRDILLADPAPYFYETTNLSLKLGLIDRAIALLVRLSEEQISGGVRPEWIAETKSWIVRLRLRARQTHTAFSKDNEDAADAAAPAEKDDDALGYSVVDVFYGTDRARTGLRYPSRVYGSGRGILELGVASVSVPHSHAPGAVDTPSIFRLELSENPVRHMVVQSITHLVEDDFYGSLKQAVDGCPRNELFVFVHGFNTSFDEALKRAAQIAYDMKYPGVPVLYSWPSRGRTTSYIADTAVVRLSARRLSRFIEELAVRRSARRIHVMAHSMGSRAVADALELLSLRLAAKGADTEVLDQLLFAAPDLDADLFREMLPSIRRTAKRVTLYGSTKDWALSASRYLHGDAPRAGQGGDDIVVYDELDSIDMSSTGDDMLAHNYYARSNSALLDIATLFWRNAAPDRRFGLTSQSGPNGSSWRYEPSKERESSLLNLFSKLQILNATAATEALDIAENMGIDLTLEEELAKFVKDILA